MNENLFKAIINKNLYQIFFFDCPASIPTQFFRHCWIVYSKKGEITRKETLPMKNRKNSNYMYTDVLLPARGIRCFLPLKKPKWESRLIAQLKGNENSLAKKIIDFVEKSEENYPYANKFCFLGPNCNTYVQWVLDNFQEYEEIRQIKLPWNAVGKGYKIRK